MRELRKEMNAQLGIESSEQRARRELKTWALGIVAALESEGRSSLGVDAIFAALYTAQREMRIPNGEMSMLLRDLAKEIVRERATAVVV